MGINFNVDWVVQGNWRTRDCSKDPDEYMYPRIEHERRGYAGGIGRVFKNAVEISEGFSASGSGKGAFGETKDWASLHMSMQFPEDRVETRRKFAEELKIFVDGFMEREGLEVKDV